MALFNSFWSTRRLTLRIRLSFLNELCFAKLQRKRANRHGEKNILYPSRMNNDDFIQFLYFPFSHFSLGVFLSAASFLFAFAFDSQFLFFFFSPPFISFHLAFKCTVNNNKDQWKAQDDILPFCVLNYYSISCFNNFLAHF